MLEAKFSSTVDKPPKALLPSLLKKLGIASDRAELVSLNGKHSVAQVVHFKYTFFGVDCRTKGEVILTQHTYTYSDFSLIAFGSVPATSSEGVFWQQPLGEVLLSFHVDFAEGEAVDSLQGTLTLFDWLSKDEQGKWLACVYSSDCEVARVKGIWSRQQI